MTQQAEQHLRRHIDALDEQLVRLLLERRRIATRIVEQRTASGGPRRDVDRERAVLAGARAHADTDEEARYLDSVFRSMIAEGRPRGDVTPRQRP